MTPDLFLHLKPRGVGQVIRPHPVCDVSKIHYTKVGNNDRVPRE